ncbi:MAG TPA: hypothetical protein VFZ28_15780 [Burkholderiaceae bacterium]|nr:hypothetical protein [Burkholderiaceae bacterium]
MNLRHFRFPVRTAVALAVLLAGASTASAAVTRVYQWHEPDGVAVLSNIAPPSNITKYSVQEVDTPAPSAKDQAAAMGRLTQYRVALPQMASANDDVELAQMRLDQALHAQQIGREPLPGERLHNVNGTSRLGPMYFKRQAGLQAAVVAAQEQLNEAYRERGEALQ